MVEHNRGVSALDPLGAHNEVSYFFQNLMVLIFAYALITGKYPAKVLAVVAIGICSCKLVLQDRSTIHSLADEHCNRHFVSDNDISETCYITPNTWYCLWSRAGSLQVVDFLVGTGVPIIDEEIIRGTQLKETTCAVWSNTREHDWKRLSSRTYQEQACMCRLVVGKPHWVYNSISYFRDSFWAALVTVVWFSSVVSSFTTLYFIRWLRREKSTNGSSHSQTVAIKFVFDKAKHDRKLKDGHGHPYLNTMRSVMRNSIAWTMLNKGSVVNLFGCKEDLKHAATKKCGNFKIHNIQVKSSYNLNRTVDQEALVDTYDQAVAVAKRSDGNVLAYDSIHYMSADQMAECMSNGKQLWFNVKLVPRNVRTSIRNPYTNSVESICWNDGVTHIEHVCSGDTYAHHALSLPAKDAFTLIHKGVTYYFSKVKLIDESVEHAGYYDQYQAVYMAKQCAMLQHDGKMSDYFDGIKAETRILLDGNGAAIGGVIPKMVDGKAVPYQISAAEWDQVTQAVNIIPRTAVSWHATVKHRLQTAVDGDERICPLEHIDGLCELAMMVNARDTIAASVGVPKTLWDAFTTPIKYRFMNTMRRIFGSTRFGWGVQHPVRTCRWITEKGLSESANGNSQEAGRSADGSGSDGASSITGSRRGARSRAGDRQFEDEADQTSTSTGNTGGRNQRRDPQVLQGRSNPIGRNQSGAQGQGGRRNGATQVRGSRTRAPTANPPTQRSEGNQVGRANTRTRVVAEAAPRTAQSARDDARAIGIIPESRLQSESVDQVAAIQPQVSPEVGPANGGQEEGPRVDTAQERASPHVRRLPEDRAIEEGGAVHLPNVEGDGSVAGSGVREGRSLDRKAPVSGKRSNAKGKGGRA